MGLKPVLMKPVNTIKMLLLFFWAAFLTTGCEKDPLEEITPTFTKEQQWPQIPSNKSYSAFAYGEISFIDAGLSETQWGWISKYQKKDDTLSFPIYMHDDSYESGDGIYVGDFYVYYFKDKLVADYFVRKGFAFMQTNLYASHSRPRTCDPEFFGQQHNLMRKTTDRHSVNITQLPVFIIGHARIVRTQ